MFNSDSKLHWIKNLYLRFRYGAGCCDTYSLYLYLAKKILKPLKEFEKRKDSFPSDLKSDKEWHEILNKMIWSFQNTVDGETFEVPYDFEKERLLEKRQQEGFELFGKYFRNLWR